MAPNANGDDFLFNLNHHFTHDSAEASGSNSLSAGSGSNQGSNSANGAANSSSILAGLNAFTPDDGELDVNAANDFNEQLKLWTDANFSFDVPTGHAILLDDEKDEEAKREEREREGERERERERRERDAANRDAPSSRRAEKARDGAPHYPLPEPTHHDHKLQADQAQQSQYFAPPSAAAGEGRRPGYGRDEYSRRHAENAAPNGTSRDPSVPVQGPTNTSQGQAPSSQPPHPAAENAFAHFAMGTHGQPQPQPQPHSQQPAMPFVSPEFLQALAFQQILSGTNAYPNPLALAGLLGVPQMPAGYPAGPVNNGFPAPFPVQPPMGAQQAQGPTNPWTAALSQLPNGAPNGAPVQGQAQAQAPAQPANSSVHSSPDPPNQDGKRDSHSGNSSDGSGNEGANGNHNKKRRHSTNYKQEESAAAREKREDAELQRVLREEIPPLQLIDTGNPEADAEANRLAIEEDKRRRNTAASARFRVKKKMREQALEQTAKELESRVRDLEEENSRLSTENGWLKSLITIRPGGGPPGSANVSAHSSVHGSPAPGNPFFNATHQPPQQGQAPPATSTFTGSGMQPQRDTGLQPRGVGTSVAGGEHTPAGSNAPLQPQPSQHEALSAGPAPVASGFKRGRSD